MKGKPLASSKENRCKKKKLSVASLASADLSGQVAKLARFSEARSIQRNRLRHATSASVSLGQPETFGQRSAALSRCNRIRTGVTWIESK